MLTTRNRCRVFLCAACIPLTLVTPATAADPVSTTTLDDRAISTRAHKIHPAVERSLPTAEARIKAWVLFRDGKELSDGPRRRAAMKGLEQSYNVRAIERRKLRRTLHDLFDENDLPVPVSQVDAIRATGAAVHVVSRWINGASVTASREQLVRIAAFDFVEKIQPVRRGRTVDELAQVQTQIVGPSATVAGFYGIAEAQLVQMRLTQLHALGYTGAGVRIGVLDTGFQRTHVAFDEPGHPLQVVVEYDFINHDSNTGIQAGDPSSQYVHGTMVLSTMGGYKPNEYVGGAYDAAFILCKTEDVAGEYPAEEDNYVAGLEFIEAQGGDLATASLAYIDWYTQADLDGMTAVTTRAVNIATANGLHCLNAAGNAGHDSNPATSHLLAPADALRVFTVGAVDVSGLTASFSSDGPTADGRQKPELLARGLDAKTIVTNNNTDYTGGSGTSFATPLLATVVACLVQAHPDWTVDQMRWYLLHTADDLVANGVPDALFVRGYGLVNAIAANAGDCNDNGIDDATDIAAQASADCNLNGLPDECDLTADPPLDVNHDGVLDTCQPPAIPAASSWGVACMALTLLAIGSILAARRSVAE